jgi:hypothetical protein
MKYACVLLVLAIAACSDSEGSPETFEKASTDAPAVPAAPAIVPLETLVAQLDSARGFFWPRTRRKLELTNATLHPERFRAHGKAGVQRLIDCMTDSTTTSTYLADHMEYKYPRAALCYETLHKLVDFDGSRQLPVNFNDLYASLQPADIEPELKRAKRAWQVIYNAQAWRFRPLAAQ